MVCVLWNQPQRAKGRAAIGFAACEDTSTILREGNRISPKRHGLEPNDGALHKAFPMPTGEVETFNTVRLTTTISDHNLPSGKEGKNSSSGTEATYGMVGSIQNFSNKGTAKALMLMGDARRSCFQWHRGADSRITARSQ